MKFAKYVLPVVIGSAAGVILIMLGERLLNMVFPLPPGTENSIESVKQAISNMPTKEFAMLMVNYSVASFAAGLLATLVAKGVLIAPAMITGVLLTASGIANVIVLPQPMWFSISNLFLYIPFCYLGYIAVRKKTGTAGNP